MHHLPKIAVAACLAFCWARYDSLGQHRLIITESAEGTPAVIQIRSQSGQVYSVFSPADVSGEVAGGKAPDGVSPERGPTSSAEKARGSLSMAVPDRVAHLASHSPSSRPRAPKNSYHHIQTTEPVVAMTFDDGPHPELTPKLLDLLKARNIRATFYVIGRNVEAYPEIARRIVEEGHEIGNHSYTHPALTRVGATRVKSEIERTTAAILQATGVIPRTMRPPYGATSAALNRRLREEFDLPVILWSVDPLDWKHRNAERVSQRIIAQAKAGDIILAHDIHPSTIAAMPQSLDALLARGLKFVTVSELLEMDPLPAPGGAMEMAAAEAGTRSAE